RPLDRPQRPHRRRPRRLLDLGRRIRAVRRHCAAHHLRGHAGAGDGAAPQIRRVARGVDPGRAGDRALARPGCGRGPRAALRTAHLHGVARDAQGALGTGADRGVLAMSSARDASVIWHEVDGWVYSSLPVDAKLDADSIWVRRLRQTVSPQGELEEELYEVGLRRLDAETLEAEAGAAGLRPAGRRSIAPTHAHVGSTAVLL